MLAQSTKTSTKDGGTWEKQRSQLLTDKDGIEVRPKLRFGWPDNHEQV